jgi:hypothetical protein
LEETLETLREASEMIKHYYEWRKLNLDKEDLEYDPDEDDTTDGQLPQT